MKIDTDLRMAIRAAVDNRKQLNSDYYAIRKKAVRELLESQRYRKRYRVAKSRLEKSKKLEEAANKFFHELGFYNGGDQIRDDDAFRRAGGKLPIKSDNPSFSALMFKISNASKSHGAKILKELGIVWE